MSEQEQPKGYMAELDQWTEEAIFDLLRQEGVELSAQPSQEIKHAIRAKVLESYKKGCRSGAGHVRKELAMLRQNSLTWPSGFVAFAAVIVLSLLIKGGLR